jgi:hypothetical protein
VAHHPFPVQRENVQKCARVELQSRKVSEYTYLTLDTYLSFAFPFALSFAFPFALSFTLSFTLSLTLSFATFTFAFATFTFAFALLRSEEVAWVRCA